ncbi:MAG: PIN domain-containing protein [Candidatus Omnitrophica bacterium]|nr:PIN domain-containing protein [Candidatus Omnitrophota bacterium]MBI4435938.1 PIN domain-containing protein [Candidatus Omnitrophota bacterium]
MVSERWRVFLDTSVLIAGLASRTGASAAIRDLGESEELRIVLSRQVLIKTDRVLLRKFPNLIERYRLFIKNVCPELADDAPRSAVQAAEAVIEADDAPILAAAQQARVDYLVTLNTKHFLIPKVRAFYASPIVTPGEFLAAFRAFWERAQ